MNRPISVPGLVLAFALGGIATWGYLEYTGSDGPDDLFNDRLFRQFESAFSLRDLDDFPVFEITTREDRRHIYYEMDIGDYQADDVVVTTSGGYVTIVANLTQNTANMTSQTRIDQTFPIPGDAEPRSNLVEVEKGKLVISFDKRR